MTGDADQGPWADAVHVDDPADCHFYQTVDLPGFGVQHGEWDLRGGVDDYLGGVDVAGKRVLEVGTANGFLCFEMERRGAEVIAYDLGTSDPWDLVPYGGAPADEMFAERSALAERLHRAWWLTHRLTDSRANVVYGTVYDVPASIGPVDVVTFGSVLLHLRDPFLALQRGAALATDTVVVTDQLHVPRRRSVAGALQALGRLARRSPDTGLPDLVFLPDAATRQPLDTWWRLSPNLVARYLAVLGFEHAEITFHTQTYRHPTVRDIPMFTVTAHRTP